MFFNRLAKIDTEENKAVISLVEVKSITVEDLGEKMRLRIFFVDDKFGLVFDSKNKEEMLTVYQNLITKWTKYTTDIEEFLKET